jgi:hypothetical protein
LAKPSEARNKQHITWATQHVIWPSLFQAVHVVLVSGNQTVVYIGQRLIHFLGKNKPDAGKQCSGGATMSHPAGSESTRVVQVSFVGIVDGTIHTKKP